MMAGVREINVYGKEILWVDYEGCESLDQMIQVFDLSSVFLIKKNEPSLVLSSFKKVRLSTPFLQHLEEQTPRLAHLIKQNVYVAMSKSKKTSLKKLKQSSIPDLLVFDSEIEAIDFLTKAD